MNKILPAYATKDDSGHWYVIPMSLKESFEQDSEAINSLPENSDEWYESIDAFEAKFGHYRTGGDLNLMQLYAEFPTNRLQ